MRYKVRLEDKGALVFDRAERVLFSLTEDEVKTLLAASSAPLSLSRRVEEAGFILDGQKNYTLVEPLRLEEAGEWLRAPNRLYLELTRACNLHCRLCYNEAGKALPNEMTTEQFQRLLDQMDSVGVFEARLTGGEPTLRADFLAILDKSLDLGLYTSLATHGVWSSALTREVCRRHVDDVIVSLDGPEEINDSFRRGGSFRRSLATIAALKESGIRKVRINTVLSRSNWRSVEPLFQLCEEYDLLLIDFIHPRPFGRAASQDARDMMLNNAETLAFNRQVKRLREKYPSVKVVMDFDLLGTEELPRHPIVPRLRACPAGREFAFISPEGYVFPCGVAPVHNVSVMTPEERRVFVAGSVLDDDLLTIWQRSPVWVPYRDCSLCKPPKCHSCRFWGSRCFGTCPIGAYYETGRLDGEDPYCYSHLI